MIKKVKHLGFNHKNESVDLYYGPYGPWVRCGKENVSLRKNMTVQLTTLEDALELIKKYGKNQ